MSEAVLRFAAVGRVYDSGEQAVQALDEVRFEVAAGELVAVMGPSGSGKSMLDIKPPSLPSAHAAGRLIDRPWLVPPAWDCPQPRGVSHGASTGCPRGREGRAW